MCWLIVTVWMQVAAARGGCVIQPGQFERVSPIVGATAQKANCREQCIFPIKRGYWK